MPGNTMKLNFLNNPAQRLASGKSLPTKKLEAIIVYGTQAQRMKLLRKILPQTFALALHKETHLLITTLLINCDNTIKSELLFAVRRKFIELSKTRYGNVVAQKIIETVPATQKKEVAELFVIGAEDDELVELARHMFGNRVAQKMMEYSMCVEALSEKLEVSFMELATHPTAQHVASKLIEGSEAGAQLAIKALFPSGKGEDLSRCEEIIAALPESTVLAALLKSPHTPDDVRESLVLLAQTNVDEFLEPKQTQGGTGDDEFEETSFGGGGAAAAAGSSEKAAGPRHTYFIAAAIERSASAEALEFATLLSPMLAKLVSTPSFAKIATALYRRLATESGPAAKSRRKEIVSAVVSSNGGASLIDCAQQATQSVLLRNILEFDLSDVSPKHLAELSNAALTLGLTQCGSPVLQALASHHPAHAEAIGRAMLRSDRTALVEAVKTVPGSILAQHVIEHAPAVRDELIAAVMGATGDKASKKKQAAAAAKAAKEAKKSKAKKAEAEEEEADAAEENEYAVPEDVVGEFTVPIQVHHAAGSRFLQKVIVFGSDEVVLSIAANFSQDESNDFHSPLHTKAVALDRYGCYVLQALLPALRTRGHDEVRKAIMNQLKRCVYDLALSPCAGRIVLDTMFLVGSEALKSAIKEVIFLKTEDALMSVPDSVRAMGPSSSSVMRTVNEGNKRARQLTNGGDRDGDGSGLAEKRKRRDDGGSRTESGAGAAAGGSSEGGAAKKPQKKAFRSLKK